MKNLVLGFALICCALSSSASEGPDYRLPAAIKPVTQLIELNLDPSRPDYTGSTSIKVSIAESVDRIGINQVGLNLTNVELRSAEERRTLNATDGEWERSWLADGDEIAPGNYTLKIDFAGSYSTDGLGMHRARFEDNDYIFTQLEAMYARRAFPAFDEPSLKVPFQLVINAPGDLTVAANTPVEAVNKKDGWQRVTFMETPPLSSYLIAYAVGPLDRVAIKGMSVPGHIYVPKGHAKELGFVLRHTPKIVAALEKYFGSKYPFRKLDFIAVPDFAFGAMENPGLITYRTDLLLVGDEVSGTRAVGVLGVIAHEVAHIWYGDLVTMAWWDDLWLNEAFATWMGRTIIESEFPQYETALTLAQSSAFAADELKTSSAIRREVRNNDEIWASVGLNYSKGSTLLRMLERYVGRDVWQRAIRRYLETYAWSNATESDLWAIVSDESGLDIAGIAGGYLNQPGFAMVSIDRSGNVAQQRYVREGGSADEQLWQIPMNVKYKVDDQVRQTYLLLTGKTGQLDLPSDPEWIFPDAGANGYFRWHTSSDQLYNLVDDVDELSNREKIALLDNSEAVLNAGSLPMADYLHVVNRMLQDPHSLVFLAAMESVRDIGEDFVTEDNRAGFAAFVDRALSARYEEVGSRPHADDSETTVRLRPRLMRVLGQFGTNQEVVADAASLANSYLKSPASIPSGLALEALRITALNDDGHRYDEYLRTYKESESEMQKSTLLSAMYFDRPEVVLRHLEYSLSGEVQAGDSLTAMGTFVYLLDDHSLLYEWLDKNFDRVVAKAPSYYQPQMPQVMAGSCEQRNLDRLTAFFKDRGDRYAASLEKAVEREEACIARKKRHLESLNRFLEQQHDGE